MTKCALILLGKRHILRLSGKTNQQEPGTSYNTQLERREGERAEKYHHTLLVF